MSDNSALMEAEDGSLACQLVTLYQERELLEDKLGVSSASEILAKFEEMEKKQAQIDNLQLQLKLQFETFERLLFPGRGSKISA